MRYEGGGSITTPKLKLSLSRDEAFYLALTVNITDIYQGTGGPAFCIKFMQIARGSEFLLDIEVERDELWLLDRVLLSNGARGAKTPEGNPVLPLLERIWDLLLGEYGMMPLFPKGSLSDKYPIEDINNRISPEVLSA